MQKILADLKPEAVYFAAENGARTAFVFFDMQKPSDLPGIAEPWFLAYNARITVTPAMTPQDLAEAAPAIDRAAKSHA